MNEQSDIISLLVSTLLKRPWERKTETGLEIFEEYKWKPLPKEKRYLITKSEGQIWLSLHGLLLDPECRKKYKFDSNNKALILKVRILREESRLIFSLAGAAIVD